MQLPDRIVSIKQREFIFLHQVVSSFEWIDFGVLFGIGDEIRALFSEQKARDFVSEERCEAVIVSVEERIRTL